MTSRLLSWFRASARDLPWRVRREPYRIWVSEVMLQQTRVAAVVPYFQRWMARFPDVARLAEASQDEVLKLWEGLGYYRRARMLHRAAQVVVGEHGGELPRTYRELLALPGIGPYTAAAVASLAFGEPVLAVDGNVRRVAARLFALPGKVTDAMVRERLGPHLPRFDAGAFNEALMELGATVCSPSSPNCRACPLAGNCLAFRSGRVGDFPQAAAKKELPHLERLALLQVCGDRLWLERRPDEGLLGGLWGFPLGEGEREDDIRLPEVHHAYTHFRITARPVVRNAAAPAGEGGFFEIREIGALALSRLDHKILRAFLDCREHQDG
ncbi:MAG TPA: A/G-specific adenine glycosylase [Trueperaceae bacterium]